MEKKSVDAAAEIKHWKSAVKRRQSLANASTFTMELFATPLGRVDVYPQPARKIGGPEKLRVLSA